MLIKEYQEIPHNYQEINHLFMMLSQFKKEYPLNNLKLKYMNQI